MRRLFFSLIVMLLLVTGCAEKAPDPPPPPPSAEYYATLWDQNIKRSPNVVDIIFRAIRIKKRIHFIDAVELFIDSRDPIAISSSDAIYTFAEIGGDEINEKFNTLLSSPLSRKYKELDAQIKEKIKALEYMEELGINLSDETATFMETEIKTIAQPGFAIALAAAYFDLCGKISDSLHQHLVQVVTDGWLDADSRDVRKLGIQADWETLITNDKENMQVQVLYFLLETGDSESLEKFYPRFQMSDNEDFLEQMLHIAIPAALGDRESIVKLIEKYPYTMRWYVVHHNQYIEDDDLISELNRRNEEDVKIHREILHELENRGYSDQVNACLASVQDKLGEVYPGYLKETTKKKPSDLLSDLGSKLQPSSGIKNFREGLTDTSALGSQISGLSSTLLSYDAGLYLDTVSNILEKQPDEETASRIVQVTADEYDLKWYPKTYDWIDKNPEKLAKAIEVIINAKPHKEWEFEEGKIPYQKEYPVKSLRNALNAMLFLPDEVFKKYFSKMKKNRMTARAELIGKFFNADWPYKIEEE